MPSETEYAYLAGIMDGEGYFAASTKSRSFGIRVAVVDACLVDWLHERFNGNVSRAGRTVTGKRVHVWYLQRQTDLLVTLRRMLPHLVIKRGQAEAMIELVEHLQAMPRYEIPSSKLSPQQRLAEGRAVKRREWIERGNELREVVRLKRVG